MIMQEPNLILAQTLIYVYHAAITLDVDNCNGYMCWVNLIIIP